MAILTVILLVLKTLIAFLLLSGMAVFFIFAFDIGQDLKAWGEKHDQDQDQDQDQEHFLYDFCKDSQCPFHMPESQRHNVLGSCYLRKEQACPRTIKELNTWLQDNGFKIVKI
jgi:hypothetical protein